MVGTGDWGFTGLGFVGGVGLAPEPGTGLHGFSGSDSLNVPAAGAGVHGHAGAGAAYGVYASAATSAQSALLRQRLVPDEPERPARRSPRRGRRSR